MPAGGRKAHDSRCSRARGLCAQVLTGEVERLGKLLEEKDALIAKWRQEASAAQEAADAASRAARESEEYAIQVMHSPTVFSTTIKLQDAYQDSALSMHSRDLQKPGRWEIGSKRKAS